MRALRLPVLTAVLSLHTAAALAQRECDAKQILQPGPCAGDELDARERRLAQLINEYRAQHGLEPIALSASLSLVANRHVRDMALNLKTLTHDWSDCPNSRECMWQAPRRLGTVYPGEGYENAAYMGGGAAGAEPDVAGFLELWKEGGKGPHNAVILNRKGPDADWRGMRWRALGIGIHRGYAVMWVGEAVDPAPLAAAAPAEREPAPQASSAMRYDGLWKVPGSPQEMLEIRRTPAGQLAFVSKEGSPPVDYQGTGSEDGRTLVLTYLGNGKGWTCRLQPPRTGHANALEGECKGPDDQRTTPRFVRP